MGRKGRGMLKQKEEHVKLKMELLIFTFYFDPNVHIYSSDLLTTPLSFDTSYIYI